MLTLIKSSIEYVEIEEAIVNSNPFYNFVSKNKETFSTEEVAEQITDAEKIGAQRFLIRHGNEYIGILEYLLLNPNDQCTWLGLLLIKKEFQAQGYGSKALELFNEEMITRGIEKYRIGVIAENAPAHKFWSKRGFVRVHSTINNDGKEIIIYEKRI